VQLFIYGALIFLASGLGGAIPIVFPGIHETHLKRYVSFGAGLLLGMALLHMVPEAAIWLPHTFGIWLAAGFVLLLILERFMMVHSCEEHGCSYHHIGVAAFLGLSVHGIIEGFALASSVVAAPELGPMIFIAILAHKMPAAFTLSTLLRLSKKVMPKSRCLSSDFRFLDRWASAWRNYSSISREWLKRPALYSRCRREPSSTFRLAIYDQSFDLNDSGSDRTAGFFLGGIWRFADWLRTRTKF
jgi:hypothetical protein